MFTICAAASALAACGSSASAGSADTAPHEVVVAAVPATGAAGLYIAQDDGMFTRAGLRVKIESSASAADTIPDLVAGIVNVSLGQWTSALAVEAHGGVRLRAVASGNSGVPGVEELVTSRDSGITRLAQLRGKVIAVNALAGLSQALTESVLSAADVSGSQVRWTVIPFPDMASALAAGVVDAAFMVQPYLSVVGRQVRELADIDTGSTQDFPITGYFTTNRWAQRNPAVLAAFSRALAEGQRIAATDPAAVIRAVARNAGITIRQGMPLGGFPLGISAAALTRVAVLMQRYALLPDSENAVSLARELIQ